jgi:microcystin-dependent protein
LMAEVSALRTDSAPVGTIMAFAGPAIKIPAGWELCDGRMLLRSADTQALFDIIGVSWGSSDNGVTTFRLPDLRGRFLRGLDASPTQGTTGRNAEYWARTISPTCANCGSTTGNVVGSVESDTTRRPRNSEFFTSTNGHHSHGMNFELTASRNPYGGSYNTVANGFIGTHHYPHTDGAGNHNHSVSGGGDNETRPQNAAVLYIIRVK